jgi:DnaJ-class molecular chaperone
MAETQLSFFDADAARDYQRQQKKAELDAWLLDILGPEGFKKRQTKLARQKAKLDTFLNQPRAPHIQAIADKMFAEVLASAKPYLADEFTLLGIERGATKRDIKNAYRRQARKLHPDAGGDEDAFKRLHDAYRRVLASVKE